MTYVFSEEERQQVRTRARQSVLSLADANPREWAVQRSSVLCALTLPHYPRSDPRHAQYADEFRRYHTGALVVSAHVGALL